MKREIELITQGGGNLGSIRRCFDRLDVRVVDVDAYSEPTGRRPLVLPGVGAFGAVMSRLSENGLSARLKQLVIGGTPYLGICVGMQVLLSASEESPGVPGLGLVDGSVVRFRQGKVPQIGWNAITRKGAEEIEGYAYFVNSYFALPAAPEVVSYSARYFCDFAAGLSLGSITAYQFHPEKSGAFGMSLMEGWLDAVA